MTEGEGKIEKLHSGFLHGGRTQILGSSSAFPSGINRKVDQKRSIQDVSLCSDVGCWCPKRWLYPTVPSCYLMFCVLLSYVLC